MTNLQKSFAASILLIAVGIAMFEAKKASRLETLIQALQKENAESSSRLQAEHDEAERQLTLLRAENERLNRNTAELLRLRDEVGTLRLAQTSSPATVQSTLTPANGNSAASVEAGTKLGITVVQGESGAFSKLLDFSKAALADFNTNKAGLNDSQRGELAAKTFAPLYAAFQVIQEAAARGDRVALDAIVQALQIPQLQGHAVKSLGNLAGKGNDVALEVLLNPGKYDLLPSGTVGALQPAAENGSQKAIAALAAVAGDASQSPLWYLAATGLEKAALSGNPVAIDAIINLSTSTNVSVQKAILPALQAAAANNNGQAKEALRALGNRNP